MPGGCDDSPMNGGCDACNKRAAHPPGAFAHKNECSVTVVGERLYYKFFA